MRKIFLLLALLPAAASAQYSGPALETCRSHATAEAKNASTSVIGAQFDNDRHLSIERHSRKLGSQFVSSVLFGNGGFVYAKGPPVEMSFVCLLADDKRALFFFWLPRRDAPVLAQCRRSLAAGMKIDDCIDPLLQSVEFDLVQLYAQRFQEAHDADQKSGGKDKVEAFRRANDAFRAYRDAECARRGQAAGDAHRACMVELSRRRQLDLQ